jgi:hypothetical protein
VRGFARLKWGNAMNFRLSTPRRETFLASVVIAILVIIGMIVPLPFFTAYALGLLLIAYLILLAGVLLDNL